MGDEMRRDSLDRGAHLQCLFLIVRVPGPAPALRQAQGWLLPGLFHDGLSALRTFVGD